MEITLYITYQALRYSRYFKHLEVLIRSCRRSFMWITTHH